MHSQHELQESGLQPSAEWDLSPLYLNRSRRLPFPLCSRFDSTDSHFSQSAFAFSSYLSPHLFYHPLLYWLASTSASGHFHLVLFSIFFFSFLCPKKEKNFENEKLWKLPTPLRNDNDSLFYYWRSFFKLLLFCPWSILLLLNILYQISSGVVCPMDSSGHCGQIDRQDPSEPLGRSVGLILGFLVSLVRQFHNRHGRL